MCRNRGVFHSITGGPNHGSLTSQTVKLEFFCSTCSACKPMPRMVVTASSTFSSHISIVLPAAPNQRRVSSHSIASGVVRSHPARRPRRLCTLLSPSSQLPLLFFHLPNCHPGYLLHGSDCHCPACASCYAEGTPIPPRSPPHLTGATTRQRRHIFVHDHGLLPFELRPPFSPQPLESASRSHATCFPSSYDLLS